MYFCHKFVLHIIFMKFQYNQKKILFYIFNFLSYLHPFTHWLITCISSYQLVTSSIDIPIYKFVTFFHNVHFRILSEMKKLLIFNFIYKRMFLSFSTFIFTVCVFLFVLPLFLNNFPIETNEISPYTIKEGLDSTGLYNLKKPFYRISVFSKENWRKPKISKN